MDPTVDVLTIYPAAWAALFAGLAEGLVFGLVALSTAALVVTVLAVILGSLTGQSDDGPETGALAALRRPAYDGPAYDDRGVVVQLAVVRQQRQQERLRA